MKKLLLTGYGPFLQNKSNPTEELAKYFDGKSLGSYQIIGRVLPVSFSSTPLELAKRLLEVNPDVVLCLGLAADRTHVTPELVAINYYHSQEPDNDGQVVLEKVLCPSGPPAYFSSLPAREIAEAINQKGIDAKVSTTAGTYVCNQTMYELAKRLEGSAKKVPWGFIHIPPDLSDSDLRLAVTTAIETI